MTPIPEIHFRKACLQHQRVTPRHKQAKRIHAPALLLTTAGIAIAGVAGAVWMIRG